MKFYSADKFKSDDQIVCTYLNLIAAGGNIINVPAIEEKGKKIKQPNPVS